MAAPLIRLVLIPAALSLGVLLTAAESRAQTRLRWKFVEGQSMAYQQSIKMQMSLGAAMNNMNQVIGMTWKVGKLDPDGKANLLQTVDSMKFAMDGPAGKMLYDSKQGEKIQGPAAALLNPLFDAMIGGEFKFKVTPLGDVTDVVVSEKVKQQLQQNPALAAMGGLFSDEGLKNMIAQSFLSFPDMPLAANTTWNKELTVKQPFGTQTIDTTYTYGGTAMHEGKSVEKISLKPKVSIKTNAAATVNLSVSEQSGTGEVLFDNQTGRIARMTMKQELKMDLQIGGLKQEQQTVTETTLEPVKP